MDENRPPYRRNASGSTASAPSYELPAYRDTPHSQRRLRVDEHGIRPELERREMVDGEVRQTFPAEFPHAVQNADLDYLLRAHVAPGYRVATDLATRHDRLGDFASDSAVVRDGIDPDTGSRHREELAFEVVVEQPKAKVTRKAPTMSWSVQKKEPQDKARAPEGRGETDRKLGEEPQNNSLERPEDRRSAQCRYTDEKRYGSKSLSDLVC